MVALGDRVKDKITGLEGIVVARHEYLHGCTRWSIQPIELKDGKPVDCSAFDEPQLELIESGIIAPSSGRDPGGPRDDPHRASKPT